VVVLNRLGRRLILKTVLTVTTPDARSRERKPMSDRRRNALVLSLVAG